MAYPAQIKNQAKALRKKGYSLNEIANQLDISKNNTSRWCKTLKLSPKTQKILEQKSKMGRFSHVNQPEDRGPQPTSVPNTKWTPEKITTIKKLYNTGLSVKDVAEKIGSTHGAINNAMRRHNIPRRTPAQTNKIKFYNSPLSFKPKKGLTIKEKQLKTAGLMLYWAEGSKKSSQKVDLANSDPQMIKLFCRFLRRIYQVDEKRLRASIYCYPSHHVKKLTKYWSSLTQIQFHKPYVRSDGGQIRDKMKHGLLHVCYSDKRLLQLIMKQIKYLSYNL